MRLNQKQAQHLVLRAGFGSDLRGISKLTGKKPGKVFQRLVDKEYHKIGVIEANNYLPPVLADKSTDEKKKLRKERNALIRELNTSWVDQMVKSETPLREKMALFWHDHFACRPGNVHFTENYLDIIRRNALGNFRTMLHDISKSAAMIAYLNNNRNRKNAPNENFAREVMELFTLGRDQGYTEDDIKEAAKAFTGWFNTRDGQFRFVAKHHDFGSKTVFGKTGEFSGEEILDMLLDNPQTSKYIVQKMVRFFVHPEGHQKLESEMASLFYESNYDIKATVEYMFTSPFFFDEMNIGVMIKSPIELIVGIQRMFHSRLTDPIQIIQLERLLGQTLFQPPNVAGWKENTGWIDSDTLPTRMQLAKAFLAGENIGKRMKISGDDNDQFNIEKRLERLNTTIDLHNLNKELGKLKSDDLSKFIFQISKNESVAIPNETLIDRLGRLTTKIEFQLC